MMLYDTAQREVVPFSPPQQVLMYVCGITPYDATHLGHASTFLTYDVVIRRLIDRGHTVRCVRNVTDVDDPLFARLRTRCSLSRSCSGESALQRRHGGPQCSPVHAAPRASSAISDIRKFIQAVLDEGHAYVSGDSVYFDVSTFDTFGAVSGYPHEEMLRLAALRGGNIDDPQKRNPLDFVLWQPSAADEPAWETPWGPGRPGWHVECSALALRELGEHVHLHGGGADLIFPHHECERPSLSQQQTLRLLITGCMPL